MRTYNLSSIKEDYLRSIFLLQGAKRTSIKLLDLADKLKLNKSTVSERLKELAYLGFVKHSKYSNVTLTRKGLNVATQLTYKHRIIEVFLHKTLGIPIHEVHTEAHLLEHAFSDRTIKKLAAFLGNPKTDPHGSPIPYIEA